MERKKVFMDTEFTGLHQGTKLISIGLVTEDGKEFYAETKGFLDGFMRQEDKDWFAANVEPNLVFEGHHETQWPYWVSGSMTEGLVEVCASQGKVTEILEKWLKQLGPVEIWSDCLAYDWVLFCNLWGHAMKVPAEVYYIPFDICTLFKMKGIDPDINREAFAGMGHRNDRKKHNALWDARVIKACYNRLTLGYSVPDESHVECCDED